MDIHVYWIILTMHGPINVKSPNNTSEWEMGFNTAFKGLILLVFMFRLVCFRKCVRSGEHEYKQRDLSSPGLEWVCTREVLQKRGWVEAHCSLDISSY
jgi:hypothetical protein